MPPRSFPTPANDRQRVEVLRTYRLDGSVPEAEFDHIVQQAVDIFQMPTALVSFCTRAVMGDDVLVVPNARVDERFASNPLVTGELFIRFYAGAPIVVPGGHRLGSVCIIDSEPRDPLTDREIRILKGLGVPSRGVMVQTHP